MAIWKWQALLAISDGGLHVGKSLPDLRGHVFAQFQGHVVLLLLVCELLVLQMRAQASPDFKRADKIIGSVLDRVTMVKIVHNPEMLGQYFMPVAHEVITDVLLLGGQRRYDFGPGGGFHGILFSSSSLATGCSTDN